MLSKRIKPEYSFPEKLFYNIESMFDSLPILLSNDVMDNVQIPKTDIKESQDSFIYEIELPGYESNEVKVDVENDMIKISAQHCTSSDKEDTENTYYLKERSCTSYKRTLKMPTNVDYSGVQGSYVNGLLTLTVPKTEDSNNKGYKVSIN